MTQRAKFIGKAASLGFEPGMEYTLLLSIHQGMFYIRYADQAVPYQSLKAFLDNWQPV